MKTNNLNFLEAVEAMKEGKKVRNEKKRSISVNKGIIMHEDNSIPTFNISSFQSTDWEVEDEEEFEEQVKKAGFELSKLKELFIIEEMKPFFEDDSLKQSLRVRLKESKDVVDEYKEKVIKAIDKCKVYPQPCPTCPFYNSGEKECQLKKELKL